MGKQIIKPIYVDLRRDYAAKTIFGKKGNEDLLLLLLKAILPEKQISQIYYTNSEHKGLREDSRGAVFDIECETDSGEDITIEVQFKSQDDFGDRMIFYSTFPVQNGVIRERKDGSYSLRYGFPKVYVIAINNFIMPIEPHDDDVITEYAVTSVKNSERYLSQDVRFVTVELPKFTKTLEELKTHQDFMIYSIIHMGEFTEMPKEYEGKGFEKLFEVSKFASMIPEEQRQYIAELMKELDQESQLATAWNDGVREGYAEGVSEGKAIGISEGEANAKLETARKFLQLGVSAELISQATGLSLEEIRAL